MLSSIRSVRLWLTAFAVAAGVALDAALFAHELTATIFRAVRACEWGALDAGGLERHRNQIGFGRDHSALI